MRPHNYLCRINDDQWIDLMKIKSLDKRSFNSLIQEGCRLVDQEKLQQLFTLQIMHQIKHQQLQETLHSQLVKMLI